MGRANSKLPSFCLSRMATRIRVRSPPVDSNPVPAADGEAKKVENGGKATEERRRVMVAVDSSTEAKSALLWALSHAVQSNDSLVLLKVSKPASKQGGDQCPQGRDPKGYEILQSMKSICQSKKPEVAVELCQVEGKDRGPAIVEEARKQGVSLLVLGQKKRSITWRLLMVWAHGWGSRMASGGVVDYCVQNSPCMTLAVRRKSRRGGGFLITTRRHKDFWLLA
ncbi:uncharacterized protein LOC110031923 [Phalaenopsis equestris]|uniref:uncharacterized protein LOC110031923 n=1 Tax=Phalaenopsis equestris TaxID=78828 RepID=UPI0009E3DD7E|nr:uncharacterized protein LOC110031923 [Phalaenopsis equestris]